MQVKDLKNLFNIFFIIGWMSWSIWLRIEVDIFDRMKLIIGFPIFLLAYPKKFTAKTPKLSVTYIT
jgi:hypothetical protein